MTRMMENENSISWFSLSFWQKGLVLETSAQETLYGGQFTLSNQFIKNKLSCNARHFGNLPPSLVRNYFDCK